MINAAVNKLLLSKSVIKDTMKNVRLNKFRNALKLHVCSERKTSVLLLVECSVCPLWDVVETVTGSNVTKMSSSTFQRKRNVMIHY